MNKKLLLGSLLGVFLVSGVMAAVFWFDSLSFMFDVHEPLSVHYYVTDEECITSTYYYEPLPGTVINLEDVLGSIYPGDTKRICFLIQNMAEESIPIATDYEGTEGILSSYNLEFSGTEVPGKGSNPGKLWGEFEFTVLDEADGTLEGTIDFGRGTE